MRDIALGFLCGVFFFVVCCFFFCCGLPFAALLFQSPRIVVQTGKEPQKTELETIISAELIKQNAPNKISDVKVLFSEPADENGLVENGLVDGKCEYTRTFKGGTKKSYVAMFTYNTKTKTVELQHEREQPSQRDTEQP